MGLFSKLFKVFFDEWETKGVSVPLMYDPVTDAASLTALFPYVSFWLTIASLIGLHFFEGIWQASVGCGMLWLLSTVLYMIRKLSKAKFDLNDRSIEFESESQDSVPTGGNVKPDSVE